MNILIVRSTNPLYNDNMMAVAKAFNYLQYNIAIWNVNDKPAFDVFSEFQPRIVIADKELSNRAYLKCIDKFSPRVVSTHTIPICGDVITYKDANTAAKELTSDYLSFISYDEKEYDKLPELPSNKVVKIFSPWQRRISQYCGPIIPEIKPLVMNSCYNFIATNIFDAYNACLLNKPVINKTPLNDNQLTRDYVLRNRTSFHAAKFIDKNVDLKKVGL